MRARGLFSEQNAHAAQCDVIRKYGFQKFGEVLKETGAGVPYGAALMKVLGTSPLGLEVRVLTSLVVTGFFYLYPFYTAMLAAVALAMTVAAKSGQRTGSPRRTVPRTGHD